MLSALVFLQRSPYKVNMVKNKGWEPLNCSSSLALVLSGDVEMRWRDRRVLLSEIPWISPLASFWLR